MDLIWDQNEVRQIFPDATWYPWDAPPIGQPVQIGGRYDPKRVGIVVGAGHVPGWWCVRVPGLWQECAFDPTYWASHPRQSNHRPAQEEVWPPDLRPLARYTVGMEGACPPDTMLTWRCAALSDDIFVYNPILNRRMEPEMFAELADVGHAAYLERPIPASGDFILRSTMQGAEREILLRAAPGPAWEQGDAWYLLFPSRQAFDVYARPTADAFLARVASAADPAEQARALTAAAILDCHSLGLALCYARRRPAHVRLYRAMLRSEEHKAEFDKAVEAMGA